MNTQVQKRTPDRNAKKRAAVPLTPSGVANDSRHNVDVVRMARAEAAARDTERRAMIADAAYYRAQKRGFEPGLELEDWLAAETEIANVLLLSAFSPGEPLASGSKP